MSAEPSAATTRTPAGIGRGLVLLLAITCGAAVANIYYAQPLLPIIGQALRVSEGTAGLLVTASQVGYALALALLVPLGDVLERRRLVSALLGVTALTLLGAAFAPGFAALLAAVALVGVTSAVAQIVVPMSASLADDESRGRVVGTVMSGLLIGILGARTLAGFVAELGGWRAVFGLGAALMLVLAVVVRLVLPLVPAPAPDTSYPRLLGTVLALIRDDPVLRVRMALAAVGFACFSVLWTAVSFLLAAPPYVYGPATIGLFGLAGLAGALAAPLAGRLADRGHALRTVTVGLVTLAVSWAFLGLGGVSLAALLAGIVLLDLAQQSLQISHQSAIYARHPQARSRVTTAFVTSAFAGGAVGSAAASTLYVVAGWVGVCVLGGVIALIGTGIWVLAHVRGIASPDAPLRTA
ncbi:MFS transporter [Pseudonocardia endophytica]|uniref:Putative MFS family arabinose efflux permease n=1 Tax=Pseudonocardia endophytica TaxID=401976 RepID=A0A4R1I1T9_PSEEN|nr:MFS transporter [Pseudonocardia endophytica]TCK26429.1 putative MFS family arabinose efflux permease [Pseudonocardia endophytica]